MFLLLSILPSRRTKLFHVNFPKVQQRIDALQTNEEHKWEAFGFAYQNRTEIVLSPHIQMPKVVPNVN
jgi:hypothetical protein